MGYILYQHDQCRVPHPLIYEQLQEWGIDISTGQLHHLLSEHKESFHAEQQQVLRVGLETASYVHTDDTGARQRRGTLVQGAGSCPVLGACCIIFFAMYQVAF